MVVFDCLLLSVRSAVLVPCGVTLWRCRLIDAVGTWRSGPRLRLLCVRLLTADLFALAIKRVLLVLISENSWIAREETVLA